MRLRIPIFSSLIALLLLTLFFSVNAQETPQPTKLSKDSLVAVTALPMVIERDSLGMFPQGNIPSNQQTIPQDSEQPAYTISTNVEDPLCDTGFDGYVDLESIKIYPWLGVEGNNVAWGPFFNNVGPITYFGLRYNELWITDDGFIVFDVHKNFSHSWIPQHISDPALPNNVIAPLWQDMEIIEDRQTNRGVSAAQTPDGNVMVLEFDDLQLVGRPKQKYDMEIVMQRKVSHKKGVYEIVFAYDNLKGTLAGPLTVGVENWAGTNASAFVNNEDATGLLKNGLIICFDAVAGAPPESGPEDVQATDGDYVDKVNITWTEVDGGETYEVYRAEAMDDPKTKLGESEGIHYQDTTAKAGKPYIYWVTTCNTFGCSDLGSHDTGWRAVPFQKDPVYQYFPIVNFGK